MTEYWTERKYWRERRQKWKLDRRSVKYGTGGKIFLQKIGVIIETKQCENVFV
jgi:hypothetical protein